MIVRAELFVLTVRPSAMVVTARKLVPETVTGVPPSRASKVGFTPVRVTGKATVTALALVLVLTAFKVHAVRGVQRGVVAVAKVAVTSGPGTTYTTEFSLHEGAELRIEEQRGEWLRVSLGQKMHGWVPAASIVSI